VGGRAWDGWIEPADSKVERFVIGKSSISSLDAAAVLAQASRVWRKVDRAFSRRCLVGAERAWKWAISRPFVPAPRNVEGTGPYSDEDWTDERFWAATELWLSTGRKEFRDRAASLADSVPVQSSAWWAEVGNMGWFSLARLGKGDPLARAARTRIAAAADSIVERLESSPGRVPDEIFPWGSNDRELEAAITLIQAWFSDPKDAYRDAALETLDWVLGRNPLDASFVTGFGTRPVRHVLSRASLAKDIAPFPGLMAGGPDGKHDDDVTADPEGVRWYGEAPAASWKDDPLSYATNEVAINWNSSLAFVLAWADRLPLR
jgi:endoglucanase